MSHDGVGSRPDWNSVLPALAVETMPTPGAQTSGLAVKSTAVGPEELKSATVSSATS